jgi:methionyl-tRNA formyltransferase
VKSVIVSSKSWHSGLANKLHEKTGHQFRMICDKSELSLTQLEKTQQDYIFITHWSYLIPEEIYKKYECVVFHMTDLPYGRGGSPLQNLIVRGHQETKLSAIKCVKELDAGPIYLQKKLNLNGSAEEIYLRVSKLIESMIIEILTEQPKPIEQKGEVTTFKRRIPEQGDFSDVKSLDEVFDRIRMLDADGYPPAFIDIGQYKLEFSRASRRAKSVIADVKISQVEK